MIEMKDQIEEEIVAFKIFEGCVDETITSSAARPLYSIDEKLRS